MELNGIIMILFEAQVFGDYNTLCILKLAELDMLLADNLSLAHNLLGPASKMIIQLR